MYRIAFVLSDKRTGGFEKQVERLSRAIIHDNHFECRIVYYSSSKPSKYSNSKEVFLNIPSGTKIKRLFFMVIGLRKYFLENPHEFIISGLHVNNIIMFLSTIGLRSKRYISMRTAPSNYRKTFKIQHIVLSNLVDGVIYNNKFSKKYFQKFCPKEICHLLPNIYDDLHEKEITSQELKVFGVLGRDSKEKNHGLVIENWNSIKGNFSLIVKGPGYETRIVNSIHFQDEFTDVNKFYDRIDCLIVPSLSEGFPNVVLEAWARGIVVAITNSANSAGIVEDGYTGLVFENSEDGFRQLFSRIILIEDVDMISIRVSALRTLNDKYRSAAVLGELKRILL